MQKAQTTNTCILILLCHKGITVKPPRNYDPLIHTYFCHCYHHFCQLQSITVFTIHVSGKFTQTIKSTYHKYLFYLTVWICILTLVQHMQASDVFSDTLYSYHKAISSPVTVFLPTFSIFEAHGQKVTQGKLVSYPQYYLCKMQRTFIVNGIALHTPQQTEENHKTYLPSIFFSYT